MSVTSERRVRRRLAPDERRSQLLDAAITVLARRSLDDVSVEDIAQAADASVGLLYHHFGSKDELANAALEAAAGQLIESLQGAATGTAAEQLVAGLAAYLAFVDDHPASWTALLRAGSAAPGGRHALIARRVDDAAITIAYRALAVETPCDALRLALRGWISFVKAACLEHLEDGRGSGEALAILLAVSFDGALAAAAAADPRAQPALERLRAG